MEVDGAGAGFMYEMICTIFFFTNQQYCTIGTTILIILSVTIIWLFVLLFPVSVLAKLKCLRLESEHQFFILQTLQVHLSS